MKQKTAMMELIDELEIIKKQFTDALQDDKSCQFKRGLASASRFMLKKSKEYLEKEKEQIINAFRNGYMNHKSSEEYFNSIFEQD